jgi:hypothetical protein
MGRALWSAPIAALRQIVGIAHGEFDFAAEAALEAPPGHLSPPRGGYLEG